MIYSELERDGRFKVKLFCVNPAANLQNYLEQGNSTIFFSATLLPIRYYKKLLSVETDDYAVYAESPFPEENRLLIIGRDVSTRYTQRGQIMYRRIAEYIAAVAEARRGNYMAFFNSAVNVLQTLVIALGAGLGIWGVINLLEGYGNDNPGAKSQGMKQFMAN